MLYNIWKWNTGIFVFQLAAVALTYEITGDFKVAILAAVLVAFAVFATLIAVIIASATLTMSAMLVMPTLLAASAMFVAGTAYVALTMPVSAFVGFAMLAAFVVALAPVGAKEETKNEHFFTLFLTAIPGVGTVAGVTILLYRYTRKQGQGQAG